MIGLPEQARIYLYTQPVDFRKGFDGLTGIVTTSLGQSVTDGSLFLFVNRKQDRIKALWWETGGLTLWYRRLEQGTVELPKPEDDKSHVTIDSVELAMWIAGLPLKSARSSGRTPTFISYAELQSSLPYPSQGLACCASIAPSI